MRRRGGPVPYELLGRARGLPTRPDDDREVPTSGFEGEGVAWGPGRTLRLPLGWVPVAGVAMVAVAVLAYIWGFSRGREDARLEAGRALEASVASRSVSDPLAQEPLPGRGGPSAPGIDQRASGPGDGPIDAGQDPRRPGFNYFVLAHATTATAPELAAFCRDRGLEARVVEDHNGVARKIVVLPGYVDGERRGDRVRAIEQRIVEVGLAWKSHRRGNADFSGYYAELHRGPGGGG